MRKCYNCKQVKPLNHYANDKGQTLGKSYCCKICKAERNQKDRLKRDYNLTQEDLEELVKSQNNSCKICYKSFDNSLRAIDHCHITGKVRGLLCSECNTGLGKFKDNSDLVQRAADYLLNKL